MTTSSNVLKGMKTILTLLTAMLFGQVVMGILLLIEVPTDGGLATGLVHGILGLAVFSVITAVFVLSRLKSALSSPAE
ncbi:MAG: hypothetical protein HQL54_04745 [Magnetococcales bacterium]|nr:hypothetical protein [Magnetococcales bacterium]